MGKKKVVLTSTFYPMSISRFFERALRRRDDIELLTAGPYTGTWIPWSGGMHLPSEHAIAPDIPLAQNAIQTGERGLIPFSMIEAQLPEAWQPDIWLQVNAGFFLGGKPKHGQHIGVGTDPHVFSYDEHRATADIFYSMQKCYAQLGDKYLPYAYDPMLHFPEERERKFDACLIGLPYGERIQLIDALRERGLNIYADLGPVFDEYRRLYCSAPVALSWSSKDDLIARVFEGLAMGRAVVCNRVPDLELFFEPGKDLYAFDTMDEAVEGATNLIAEPTAARLFASCGMAAVAPHTYDVRVQQILDGGDYEG